MENHVPRILVVDDEEDLRENLKYVFKSKGFEVELAGDGLQALKKLETYRPDLIVLDLNMPNMGGIEFYQRICEGEVPRYPVFVLTARAHMEQFFKEFNVDGFMAKPFEIPELLKEVETIIAKKAQQQVPAGNKGRLQKVFIIDNDELLSGRVGAALLGKGLTVNLARTGAEGIERISRDVPDIACVKMSLPDISGDVVIFKLKRMAKTSGVKCLLFAPGMADQEAVSETIRHKPGIEKFVVVHNENDLIDAIGSM